MQKRKGKKKDAADKKKRKEKMKENSQKAVSV